MYLNLLNSLKNKQTKTSLKKSSCSRQDLNVFFLRTTTIWSFEGAFRVETVWVPHKCFSVAPSCPRGHYKLGCYFPVLFYRFPITSNPWKLCRSFHEGWLSPEEGQPSELLSLLSHFVFLQNSSFFFFFFCQWKVLMPQLNWVFSAFLCKTETQGTALVPELQPLHSWSPQLIMPT